MKSELNWWVWYNDRVLHPEIVNDLTKACLYTQTQFLARMLELLFLATSIFLKNDFLWTLVQKKAVNILIGH